MLPGQSAHPQNPGLTAAPRQYGPNTGSHPKHSRHATSAQHPTDQQAPRSSSVLQRPSASSAARGVRQSPQPGAGSGGQQGSGGGTRPARAGLQADEGSGPAEGAEELVLQEDEVDWGGDDQGASDPALQHALAVIRAKGEH